MKSPWKTGPEEEIFLSSEIFWRFGLLSDAQNSLDTKFFLRLRLNPESDDAIVELAAPDNSIIESLKKHIDEFVTNHSIYKNRIISVNFDRELESEYGELTRKRRMKIEFLNEEKIDDEKIVLTEETKDILKRSIFDFFAHAQLLQKHGVALKRGLLFYGPPGTGKTYTCKYVHSKLRNVSTLIATGQSLLQIKSLCNLAKNLQPCMVILEDIDLIFSARELNPYSGHLGDLMDELDGFASADHVLFILTTNGIERLEKAIRDRPGRISQCIHFGLPGHELRKRYIGNEVGLRGAPGLNIDAISQKIDGASQAFISEMIRYAIQLNLERIGYAKNSKIGLTNTDFDAAISLMVRDNNEFSNSIIGLKSRIL